MSNKNILTPVDFSANSVQAFDFALQYAKEHKIILHLLHVINPFFSESKSDFFDELFIMKERIRNANEELKKFVNEIPHPGVEIVESLRIGKPHEQILNYSAKGKIDLIIIASHGWTATYSLTTGSVAGKIIELSNIPVICLRSNSISQNAGSSIIRNTIAENWVG
jgi:nucleotide-binding universal stress UspA family protein